MARDWVLELKPENQEAHSMIFRLWVKDLRTGNVTEMVPPCGSVDEFREAVSKIKSELDLLVEEAQRELKTLGKEGEEAVDPRGAWEKMESLDSEKEMFDYFNSFSEVERERIAEYILSHVNMFKGRGPVFSEHYDATTHLLD